MTKDSVRTQNVQGKTSPTQWFIIRRIEHKLSENQHLLHKILFLTFPLPSPLIFSRKSLLQWFSIIAITWGVGKGLTPDADRCFTNRCTFPVTHIVGGGGNVQWFVSEKSDAKMKKNCKNFKWNFKISDLPTLQIYNLHIYFLSHMKRR